MESSTPSDTPYKVLIDYVRRSNRTPGLPIDSSVNAAVLTVKDFTPEEAKDLLSAVIDTIYYLGFGDAVGLVNANPAKLDNIFLIAEAVASNASITYLDVLDSVHSTYILPALNQESLNLKSLILRLMQLAKNDAEVGIIAAQSDLVQAIIKVWLCENDTGVSQRAWTLLAQLLKIGPEGNINIGLDGNPGGNLMWKRILGDKDVYDSFFSWTSIKTVGQPGQPRRRAKGLAQARIMDFITAFAHVPQLWISQHSDIEELYSESAGGLAQYVLASMVDKDDLMEYMQLLECYASLIFNRGARTLEHLESYGIHQELISRIDQDSDMLHGSIIRYITAYVANYQQHFLDRVEGSSQLILLYTARVISSTRSNQWAQNKDPTGLLELLASLPRLSILLNPATKSAFLSLPLIPGNSYILLCLARIFSAKNPYELAKVDAAINAATSRALFLLYLGQHPDFFSQILASATQIINIDVATAAIEVLSSLTSVGPDVWTTNTSLSNHIPEDFPSETDLQQQCTIYTSLPSSGIAALLLPPAINQIIPFLLSSSKHLTGEAYPIAEKKWDLINAFYGQVQSMSQGVGGQVEVKSLVDAIAARLRNGILGAGVGVSSEGGVEEVVHSVATVSR